MMRVSALNCSHGAVSRGLNESRRSSWTGHRPVATKVSRQGRSLLDSFGVLAYECGEVQTQKWELRKFISSFSAF
jgi:hypothetical protein